MLETFPAIIIGGPPHSGKSVLVYSLTKALRELKVPHYVLRACPDGDGDWANESDQRLVQNIRVKGEFTSEFTEKMIRFLRKRHLPLLVDVGGLPTPEQEKIFDFCTHAVLVIGDREENAETYFEDMERWQQKMKRHHVPIIAQLKSSLNANSQLIATNPIVTGVINDLNRGSVAQGPLISAIVEKLAMLCDFKESELTSFHLSKAPAEITLDLPSLARTLGSQDGLWRPDQLPILVDYLPEKTEMAAYGRAPNWVYALLSLITFPEPYWVFDARLGWTVAPNKLPIGDGLPSQEGWKVGQKQLQLGTLLELDTMAQYIEPNEPDLLPISSVPNDHGLIISGKVPNWLLSAVVRTLALSVPWTAIFQPPIGGAVVVHSRVSSFKIGDLISLQTAENF